MLTNQLDLGVGDGTLGIALSVSLKVAQVANVAVGVFWSTVALAEWVDWYLLACVVPSREREVVQ